MNFAHLTWWGCLALLLGQPVLASDGAGAEHAARERAEAAANALGSTLKQALVSRMRDQGPLAAVDFCHGQAQPLTAQVAAEQGVRLGRVGVRLRNPENAAEGWQQAALEALSTSYAATGSAEPSVQLSPDGSHLRYARPIRTEGPCLVCHGPAVDASLLAAIRERYPRDAATGFAEGELRGALWVEVPLVEAGDR